MVLLPKLIFMMLNAVIDIPEATVNKIQTILNNFIWRRKRPRLKLTTVEKNVKWRTFQTPKNTTRLPVWWHVQNGGKWIRMV